MGYHATFQEEFYPLKLTNTLIGGLPQQQIKTLNSTQKTSQKTSQKTTLNPNTEAKEKEAIVLFSPTTPIFQKISQVKFLNNPLNLIYINKLQ